jgi:hypothetical protein
MTELEAEKFQNWRGMTGATAFHIIGRHADGWTDISTMMKAWLKANTEAAVMDEREACAMVCEAEGIGHRDGFGEHCAAIIRRRPNG